VWDDGPSQLLRGFAEQARSVPKIVLETSFDLAHSRTARLNLQLDQDGAIAATVEILSGDPTPEAIEYAARVFGIARTIGGQHR